MLSGSKDFIYGPELLLQKGLIFVSMNYRLNSLGFLSLITKDTCGNAAMKDIILSLKWIKRNIIQFGGDENKVTIGGHSSGGTLVHLLMLSKKTTGLFQRAIIISGGAYHHRAISKYPKEKAFRLGKEMGIDTKDPNTLLETLKNLDYDELIAGYIKMSDASPKALTPYTPFIPIIEKDCADSVLDVAPEKILSEDGLTQKVPLLIGFNTNEGIYLLPRIYSNLKEIEEINNNLELLIPPNIEYPSGLEEAKNLAISITRLYFGQDRIIDNGKFCLFCLTDYITDVHYPVYNTDAWIRKYKARNDSNSLYLYEFSFDGSLNWAKLIYEIDAPGVSHADELGYLFLTNITKDDELIDERNRKMRDHVTFLFSNFIKYGNPTPNDGGSIMWPEYSKEQNYLIINDKPIVMQRHLSSRTVKTNFWDKVYEDYENYLKRGGVTHMKLYDKYIIVKTHSGPIRGKLIVFNGFSYYSFQGIPYAESTAGKFRFLPPVPKKPWSQVYDAFQEGPVCPQARRKDYHIEKMDEDCLYLNIYVPAYFTKEAFLPVYVNIHGGGHNMLSGSKDFIYGPELLLKKGLIFVSMNYRLNSLGFLSLNIKDACGNAALKDVILSLKWIKRNLKQFGGDESKITIGGHSSGGTLVHLLMLSKKTTGLFQRAIIISGGAYHHRAISKYPEKNAFRLGKEIGIDTKDPNTLLEALKNLDYNELIAGYIKMSDASPKAVIPYTPFIPIIEKDCHDSVLDVAAEKILSEDGLTQKVPLLIGFNTNEGINMLPNIYSNLKEIEEINNNLELLIPSNIEYPSGSEEAQNLAKSITKFYFGKESIIDDGKFCLFCLTDYITDSNYPVCNTDYWVEKYKGRNDSNSLYLYEFSFDGSLNWAKLIYEIDAPGVSHADELGYLFLTNITKDDELIDERNRKMRDYVTFLFSNFIKYGNPTPNDSGGIMWPEYGKEQNYLIINDKPIVMQRHLSSRTVKTNFWDKVYEDYENYLKNGGVTHMRLTLNEKLIVRTHSGLVKGKLNHVYNRFAYYSFQGIPYAESTAGKFRFMPPVAKKPWNHTLDATREGPVCPQAVTRYQRTDMSEDCLNLNVYIPGNITNKLLSVWVHIHGGGLALLSGNSDFMYGPQFILQKDVIFVTLNHRLHAFGFLSLNTEGACGNAGIKDILLALKWINQNIERFGGDKNKITLGGNSSGAILSHFLMFSNKAVGLFQQLLLISGSALHHRSLSRYPKDKVITLANVLGIKADNSSHLIKELQKIDPFKLTDAYMQMAAIDRNIIRSRATLSPSVDNMCTDSIFQHSPAEIFANGLPNKVPMLMGVNSNEGAYMIPTIMSKLGDVKELSENIERLIPSDIEYPLGSEASVDLAKAIAKLYFGKDSNIDRDFCLYCLTEYITDAQYAIHSIDSWARKYKEQNDSKALYLYQFGFDGMLNWAKIAYEFECPGASHSDELGYLFLTQFTNFSEAHVDNRSRKMRDTMVTLFTDFVKHGNPTPNNNSGITWPEFGKEQNYLSINDKSRATILNYSPATAKMLFWDNVYTEYNNYINKGNGLVKNKTYSQWKHVLFHILIILTKDMTISLFYL
ncbi:unnamed protein product [Leptosia nina]|uniref:Carboxylesterase type B domain-containing protein n=1 Tax=Leptosia nina TaxID=320188 RepID=A0AAV1JRL6_9NEOP